MGLFGKKIQGDELLRYIDYLGEEWNLKAFQDQESELYRKALAKYNLNKKDPETAQEMFKASDRLAQSASEILRRKDKFMSVPEKAKETYFAWHAAYTDYLNWTNTQADAFEARLANAPVDNDKVKELQAIAEKSHEAATAEEAKLHKLLNLTDADIQGLMDKASEAALRDRWLPRTVTYAPKFKGWK